jgi:hypothetical protein
MSAKEANDLYKRLVREAAAAKNIPTEKIAIIEWGIDEVVAIQGLPIDKSSKRILEVAVAIEALRRATGLSHITYEDVREHILNGRFTFLSPFVDEKA